MWYDAQTGQLRDDPLERDATIAALDRGLDPAELITQLRAQQKLDTALNILQDRYADSFEGLYWADTSHAVAQFKSPIPDDAWALLAGTGVPITLQIVRYSSADLNRLQDELAASLRELGLRDYAVASDTRAQGLVATIGKSGPRALPSEEEIRARLPGQLLSVDIHMEFVNGPVALPWSVLGGAIDGQNPDLWCTSGFSVYSGSTQGTATAGHCGTSMNWYKNPFTGATHSLTYKNGYIGTWGDFEWFTSNGAITDDFYHTSAGSVTDVSSVKSSFSVGDTLYWYGQATNQEHNGTVSYTRVAAGGRDHLVCMSNNQGGPGDSGGPVYAGGSAAGYIFGSVNLNGWRMCFSEAAYIDDAIGVSIKLS
jgi:streptogrisin C